MITVPAPLPFLVMLHAALSRDHASVDHTSCLSILHNCIHLSHSWLIRRTIGLQVLRHRHAETDESRGAEGVQDGRPRDGPADGLVQVRRAGQLGQCAAAVQAAAPRRCRAEHCAAGHARPRPSYIRVIRAATEQQTSSRRAAQHSSSHPAAIYTIIWAVLCSVCVWQPLRHRAVRPGSSIAKRRAAATALKQHSSAHSSNQNSSPAAAERTAARAPRRGVLRLSNHRQQSSCMRACACT